MRLRAGARGPNISWRLVLPVVAAALGAVTLGMLVCLVYALGADEGDGARGFAIGAGVTAVPAALGLLARGRFVNVPLRARDGFLAVTLTWLAASAFGAVPFAIEGSLPRYGDAFFESISGFTTTGATLIDRTEGEPGSILLWRSITQWIGGVGIVVLVVAIAPAVGLSSQRVFFAETTGVRPQRLTPRIAETAKIIWGIYLTLTLAGMVSYLVAGMTPFEAINHGLTTLASGGFSTRTASIGGFDSLAIELVAIVFMALSGINFAFYWRAMRGGPIWPQAAEVRVYLLVLVTSALIVAASLVLTDHPGSVWKQLRDSSFAVTSVMTSTGYTTAEFDDWGDYARAHLLLLMFIGGCAGSTAGGMKIVRTMLLARTASQEVTRQLQPKAVQVLRTRGQVYSEEIRRGVLGFFFLYMTVALVGTMAMLVSGLDLLSAMGSVSATLNVIGPGIGDIGATENYGSISDGGRVVLASLMLIGRLEVFTVLVLLTPAFWRPNVA